MKKRFSVLVAMVMLLTTLLPSFTVNAAFSDVADTNPYKKAITTLSTLDVINGYEDGTFAPEKEISRAEFTKMIVYMLNYGHFTTPITQFTDVPETHWANANIKTAYDLGIINGIDDYTFMPDAPVTYEQALTMVIRTLGYTAFAEALGGYPNGYTSQATELKLTQGISGVAYTANAPRGVIAQIMYNALEVEMYAMVSNKWQLSGKTLLNDYLSVNSIKGIVVGVEDSTTSDCDSTLSTGKMAIQDAKTAEEIVVDFSDYGETALSMKNYLGRTVNAYYTSDRNSDDKWLVAIESETTNNVELELNSFDIDSYQLGNLKYFKNDKTQRASIDLDNLAIRYNGRAVTAPVTINGRSYELTDALTQWLDPSSSNFIYGTVSLIDNGSSNQFSMVDIYDYDTIVAYKTPSATDYKITDKTETGKSLVLDPDAMAYDFTITKGGKEIETTQITANDVINYAMSLDGKYYSVAVSSEKVSGKITGTNLPNNSITIGDKEYNISDRFIKYMNDKEQRNIEIGIQITAYTDAMGTLEWGTVTSSEKFAPYAYVIDAVSENDSYYLQLFAPTNTAANTLTSSTAYKAKTFKLSESSVKLNGKKSTADGIIAALEASAETANPDKNIDGVTTKLTKYNQLVRVTFNSSGEIDNVITISDTEGKENSNTDALVRYKGVNTSSPYYVTTTSVKESSSGSTLYSLRSSTPLFIIPADRTDTDSYSLKGAISSSAMQAGTSHYVEAYDLNSSKYPTCVVVYASDLKGGTAITYDSLFSLLYDEISSEYDSKDGDTYDSLNIFASTTSTSSVRIADSATSTFASLDTGDVVLYSTNGDNEANGYMLVMDYDNVKRILNGATVDGKQYNWSETQTQTAANNWQKYTFDWRYPKDGVTSATDNYYKTGGNSSDIYSRAAMFNVLQVVSDENVLYLSQNGFNSDNTYDDDYETIRYSSSTKIVRYDEDNDVFTSLVGESGSAALTINDLKEATIDGIDCSKVLVTYTGGSTTQAPTAKFIVIYD